MRTLLLVVASGLLLGACSATDDHKEEAGLRISLEAPADGAVVEDIVVKVRGRARSEASLTKLVYLVNGAVQHSVLLAETEFVFDQAVKLRGGANLVEVVGTDAAGAEARVERSVTTTAEPAEIVSFTASPAEARPGIPVELHWAVRGTDPVQVVIPGIGDVTDRTSTIVMPTATTPYELVVSNRFGTQRKRIDALVRPELVPNVTVVAAGRTQFFHLAGVDGVSSWSVSGGTVEPQPDGSMHWDTPAEPGIYEIKALHARGSTTHPIEVRAIDTLQGTFVGVAGQPALEDRDSFAVAADGVVWAFTRAGFARNPAGGTSWTLQNDGLTIHARSLRMAPDGTIWAGGYRFDLETKTNEMASWDPVARQWVTQFVLPSTGDFLFKTATFGSDGSASIFERTPGTNHVTLWRRSGPEAAWERGPQHPTFVSAVLQTPDGDLYTACADCFGSETHRLPAGSAAWEPLGNATEYTTKLHLDATGAVVASGIGLARLAPDDTWQDMTAGLPDSCGQRDDFCWVEGFVIEGETWSAITADGLFVREGDGPFSLRAALPAPEQERGTLRGLAGNGSGDLWFSGVTGIWHLPAGEETFRSTAPPGLPGDYVSPVLVATAPDGTVALSLERSGAGPEVPLVALRRPDSTEWIATGPARSDDARAPSSLRFAPDGTLVLTWANAVYEVPSGSTAFEALPLAGLPADEQLHGINVLPDGTRLILAGTGKAFRLEGGATAWTALPAHESIRSIAVASDGTLWGTSWAPAGAHRLLQNADTWEEFGADRTDSTWLHGYREVIPGWDGTLWMRTDSGILRFEDSAWRPIGSGPCGWFVRDFVLTSAGDVYCSSHLAVYRLDQEDDIWVPIGGLPPGTHVAGIDEGPDGNLWVRMGGAVYELRIP